MSSSPTRETVSIRPGVTILSVLRSLNYRPWFALAEFVDNSLQSSFDHAEDFAAQARAYKLKVQIRSTIRRPTRDPGQCCWH